MSHCSPTPYRRSEDCFPPKDDDFPRFRAETITLGCSTRDPYSSSGFSKSPPPPALPPFKRVFVRFKKSSQSLLGSLGEGRLKFWLIAYNTPMISELRWPLAGS
ncbi:hypothetical protein CEXT_47471 [Caerostris extrusa]|uniref:Uncharacterized protein n=1 Tax=Caerostris extrusa TaxID=172846 RepID=A0AAV4VJH6_CAEEX|nr:hypothetical protein CEXT_47471 [Caerostris extrusa]